MTENDVATRFLDMAFRVHRKFGPGLLESAYERALTQELNESELEFERQIAVPVSYNGVALGPGFRADFIVENAVLIEIKSVERTSPVHRRQLLTYLRLTGLRLGLLVNFGEELLRKGISRVANNLPE
jgi:GxxExxY protein